MPVVDQPEHLRSVVTVALRNGVTIREVLAIVAEADEKVRAEREA